MKKYRQTKKEKKEKIQIGYQKPKKKEIETCHIGCKIKNIYRQFILGFDEKILSNKKGKERKKPRLVIKNKKTMELKTDMDSSYCD